MRILLVGGTQFVGRHIAAAALESGHRVTLLHRGRTGMDLFPAAEHLLADRDDDLSTLSGRSYDATVDVTAYYPRHVRSLAQALDDRGGRYLFISSVSAYAEPEAVGGDESTPLAELETDDPDSLPMTSETYGGLKVCCERAASAAYGADAVTIVRPTYVVGPYDHSGRFTWWVDRLARGGRVLCPGPATAPVQLIDARDQASWVVSLLETGTTGAYHSCWPEPPWSLQDMIETIRAEVAPPGTELVWVPADRLLDARVDGSALPLWSEGTVENASAMDPAAARRSGLSPRPVADTVRDTHAWMRQADWRQEGVGIDAAMEQALLDRLV